MNKSTRLILFFLALHIFALQVRAQTVDRLKLAEQLSLENRARS